MRLVEVMRVPGCAPKTKRRKAIAGCQIKHFEDAIKNLSTLTFFTGPSLLQRMKNLCVKTQVSDVTVQSM